MTDEGGMSRVRAFRERMSYPTALCNICGAIVRRGEGERSEQAVRNLPGSTCDAIDAIRAKSKLPALDGWRRAHDDCASLDYAGMLARITGLAVTAEVAWDALTATRLQVLAWREAPIAANGPAPLMPAGRAWHWIDQPARDELRRLTLEAKNRMQPSRCTLGACAFCGLGEAMGWTESPLTWRDGSSAPLCGPCNTVYGMRSEPTERVDVRAVALQAFTGYAELAGPTLGMRPFIEVVANDDERVTGYAEPWAYRPDALGEVRRRAWEARPSLAPADEAERIRARQLEELRAAYLDEQAEAERTSIEATGISWVAPAHDGE